MKRTINFIPYEVFCYAENCNAAASDDNCDWNRPESSLETRRPSEAGGQGLLQYMQYPKRESVNPKRRLFYQKCCVKREGTSDICEKLKTLNK